MTMHKRARRVVLVDRLKETTIASPTDYQWVMWSFRQKESKEHIFVWHDFCMRLEQQTAWIIEHTEGDMSAESYAHKLSDKWRNPHCLVHVGHAHASWDLQLEYKISILTAVTCVYQVWRHSSRSGSQLCWKRFLWQRAQLLHYHGLIKYLLDCKGFRIRDDQFVLTGSQNPRLIL